jgi:hypothetical protein
MVARGAEGLVLQVRADSMIARCQDRQSAEGTQDQ